MAGPALLETRGAGPWTGAGPSPRGPETVPCREVAGKKPSSQPALPVPSYGCHAASRPGPVASSCEVSAFRPRTVGRRAGRAWVRAAGSPLRQGGRTGGALRIARPLPQLGYPCACVAPAPTPSPSPLLTLHHRPHPHPLTYYTFGEVQVRHSWVPGLGLNPRL